MWVCSKATLSVPTTEVTISTFLTESISPQNCKLQGNDRQTTQLHYIYQSWRKECIPNSTITALGISAAMVCPAVSEGGSQNLIGRMVRMETIQVSVQSYFYCIGTLSQSTSQSDPWNIASIRSPIPTSIHHQQRVPRLPHLCCAVVDGANVGYD